jgi:hypothetical protein
VNSTDEQMPDHIINAICANPRHARGKVAFVVAFGRFTSTSGEVRWLIRDDGGSWHYTRLDADGVYRRYGEDAGLGSTYRWPCKLCSRPLEVREDTLHRMLESAREGLLKIEPAQSVSDVPIATLRAIASNRMQ